MLARHACDPAQSRGRRIAEPRSPARSEYQRDRDRIIHSTGFRRLVYKTQVFINHEGDLFRTRMTHSLEVAQLGRAIARTLEVNEDLVEAIALAHDLGHTPFGHAGQEALHECMRDHGGFEHNLQSLRVVDQLEQRYPRFDGLNLCLETREGVLKRCSPRVARALDAVEPGGVARRFIARQQPSLEAQLVNLADEIAYNAHDIDDGVRSGLLDMTQLKGVPIFMRHHEAALAAYPELATLPRRLLPETLRRIVAEQVLDVVATTSRALDYHAPASAEEVRKLPPLVGQSEALREQAAQLKRFLFDALYRHPQVMRTTERARLVVHALFAAYVASPREMPGEQAAAFSQQGHRVVSDYIAGMTDRFAGSEFARLTGQVAFAAA